MTKAILCTKFITIYYSVPRLKEYVEGVTNDLKAIPEDFEKSEYDVQWPEWNYGLDGHWVYLRMPSMRHRENSAKGERKMPLEQNNHFPLTGFLHKP